MPAPASARVQVPSTAQRVIPPARHGAKSAEMFQEWQAALRHKVGAAELTLVTRSYKPIERGCTPNNHPAYLLLWFRALLGAGRVFV